MDPRTDTQHGNHGGYQLLLSLHIIAVLQCRVLLLGKLYVDLKGIFISDTIYQDLVVRCIALLQQNRFDLGREYIHATDDEHVIAASLGFAHLNMGTSAGALLPGQYAEITGPVTDQRESFLGDAGEYQLSFFTLRKNLTGLRIDDLGNEMIFVDVHAALLFTLEGYTRSGDLGQSVDIISLDAQFALDLVPHFLCPGLCTEDTCLQADIILGASHFIETLCQISRIRRCAAKDRRIQIPHELDLTLCISGRHGDGQASHLVGTAVKSRASGEQTVTVADLHYIFLGCTGCHQCSGAAVLPEIQVVLCIKCNHTASCGTAGGLDPYTVLRRTGQKSVGICLAKIVLRQERQLGEILQALDILRLYTLLIHQFMVVFVILINIRHLLDQALFLQFLDLLDRHGLDLRLEILLHSMYSFCFTELL